MSFYDGLRSFERQVMNQVLLKEKIEKNRIVVLKSKGAPVLVGESLGLKVNASVGLNAKEEFGAEREKVKEIQRHTIHPDTMMDLSTQKVPIPLYQVIASELGCPVGTIPYYSCFTPEGGIDKAELLDTIEEQAAAGVAFMTLHLTADLGLAEQATRRLIPVISRGGSLLLRDIKKNRRSENILLECLDEIVGICKKYCVVINVGTTFRPSTLLDALDDVNLRELEQQKELCMYLIKSGISVQMEGIGHIPMLKIPDYVRYLRKEIYIPFMPLGPIVSDRTSGQDHITAAVGAAYMAALGGADIINAVTREEHTGGIPTTHSILEAIDTACTVAQIVNDTRFPNLTPPKNKYHNCMGDPEKIGCDRCGQECPFLWNNID